MVRKIGLALIVAVLGISVYAQKVEEVTLTVSGDGATQKEATEVALRSAIEQAFGVFVSTNTTIMDDELVKDEIATVSSGNIKSYKEIASAQLPNGNTSVTLQAVVSVSKLITYAQSKGSSAEFAGATFSMNMKLRELNKVNEEKAIVNMIAQLEALAPTMFDYKIEIGEPKVGKNKIDKRSSDENQIKTYIIPATIDVIYNKNTETANSIFLNTLTSLSLSEKEREEYGAADLPFFSFCIGTEIYRDNGNDRLRGETIVNLRSEKSKELLIQYVDHTLGIAIISFQIIDNLNTCSSITKLKGKSISSRSESIDDYRFLGFSGLISRAKLDSPLPETSVMRNMAAFARRKYGQRSTLIIPHIIKKFLQKNGLCYQIEIEMTVSKEDISKYSKFEIKNKTD